MTEISFERCCCMLPAPDTAGTFCTRCNKMLALEPAPWEPPFDAFVESDERARERDRKREVGVPALGPVVYCLLMQEARRHGYALAVHGSMCRDFDFIAIAWTEDAIPAAELVEHLRDACNGMIDKMHSPHDKPHGRRAWTINLVGSGAHIDLSVIGP